MRADYLNPLIDSFREVIEPMFQLNAKKGELTKVDSIDTNKTYTIYIPYTGELTGFFAISFDDQVTKTMVDVVQPGAKEEEIEGIIFNLLKEVGEMTKNKSYSKLTDLTYKIQVEDENVYKKDKLPKVNGNIIKLNAPTEYGEVDLYLQLNKNR